MNRLLVLTLTAVLTAAGAPAAVKPGTPTPMPKVKARMKAVVDKASTDLFNTAGEADPENGPDQKLPDAAGWARLKADADQLQAAARFMLDPKIGKTSEAKWTGAARAMADLSAAASRAAAARDPKALAKAANDLSDTCTACHSVYKKQD